MADIVLTGDTSGAITVAAPAVAGTNTLTLPASTGTMITSATAAADVPKPTALSTASGSAPSYSARAWVNFNGTGTVAIRASGNVSSITDIGVGQYQVNFATAMSDVNYAYSGMVSNTADAWSSVFAGAIWGAIGIQQTGGTAPTTAACRFESVLGSNAVSNGSLQDFSQVTINFFR